MRGRLGALAGALVLVAAGLTGPGVAPSAAGTGRPLPSYLSLAPEVRQLVTVTSDRWSATRARMSAWQRRDDDSWRRVRGPVTVRLGWNGWVRAGQRPAVRRLLERHQDRVLAEHDVRYMLVGGDLRLRQ